MKVLMDGVEKVLAPHFSSELNSLDPDAPRFRGLCCMAVIENGQPVSAHTLPREALRTPGAKFRTGGHDWEVPQ